MWEAPPLQWGELDSDGEEILPVLGVRINLHHHILVLIIFLSSSRAVPTALTRLTTKVNYTDRYSRRALSLLSPHEYYPPPVSFDHGSLMFTDGSSSHLQYLKACKFCPTDDSDRKSYIHHLAIAFKCSDIP
jgi:hypothetical protein